MQTKKIIKKNPKCFKVVHKCVAGMKTLVIKGVFIPVLWNKSPNAAYPLTSIEVHSIHC